MRFGPTGLKITAIVISVLSPRIALSSDFTGYAYDALGQLTGVCRFDSAGEHLTRYQLDAAGNRQHYENGDRSTTVLLGVWAEMRSPNQRYVLVMQGDGNLVLYSPTRALWATNTAGNDGATASFQTDGNLVVGRNGAAIWSSGTDGNHCGGMNVQDDGNLVIYAMDGRPVWASNTAE